MLLLESYLWGGVSQNETNLSKTLQEAELDSVVIVLLSVFCKYFGLLKIYLIYIFLTIFFIIFFSSSLFSAFLRYLKENIYVFCMHCAGHICIFLVWNFAFLYCLSLAFLTICMNIFFFFFIYVYIF